MLNYIVRIFGLSIKYFGVFGMVVMLFSADFESFLIFFFIFYLPGNYLSKTGISEQHPKISLRTTVANSYPTSIVSSYPIGYLGTADVYSDRIILRYWTSKTTIDINNIVAVEKLGFLDSIMGRNIKIVADRKIIYISTPKSAAMIEAIEKARMNLRNSRPQTLQQNVVQNIVQGDTINKTEIRDSVLNRSNIGDSDDNVAKIEKIIKMRDKGLIDDEEFSNLKKDILRK